LPELSFRWNVVRKAGRIKGECGRKAVKPKCRFDTPPLFYVLLTITDLHSGFSNVFLTLLSWAYAAVALIFMMMTFLEGWANRDGFGPRRLGGFLACLFWPLMLVFFLLHGLFGSKTPWLLSEKA
jgi:hypothetical protein